MKTLTDSEPPAPRRRVGGRSALVMQAVADAVMAELVEGGVENFSVPRVAARAGVNSSSIYRRWATKGALIAFAGGRWAEALMPTPDLGSLRSDLVQILENGQRFVNDPRGRALVALNFGEGDSATDAGSQGAYWQQRLQQHQAIFDRAIARGELAAHADVEEILERTIGPLYARTFISRRPLDRDFFERVVDAALFSEKQLS
ncbi:TetR/AcrR family transcriptional regulator [Acidovorax sp. Q11]